MARVGQGLFIVENFDYAQRLYRGVRLMSRVEKDNAVSESVRVLVADSTLLTGGLIANALRRDRKLHPVPR